MHLLITGGAGFIGSNFVRYMYKKYPDYTLVNLDKLTYAGRRENLQDLEGKPNYTFVQGDICDEELVAKVLKDYAIEAIVHFAAESHVDRSITGPSIFVTTNVLGTQTLLEGAKKANIKKFYHISTDEVYGALTLEDPNKFTEKTPLSPHSPYSASKAGSDLLVQAYYTTYGLPTVISRCSNNYGPYQFPEKVIPVFIKAAMTNQPLPVYGDGLYVRDWIHVEDHCRASDLILHAGKVGEVYNVGGGNERSNIEIARLILKELGKPESLITHVKDRPGHDRRYAIEDAKIRKELGFQPEVNFEEGIRRTIEWYTQKFDPIMNTMV